jgi:prepilin peptidase CpaA
MNLEIALLLIISLVAITEDLARRRISNYTSGAAAVGGLLCQVMRSGWRGLGYAAGGLMVGFSVFLIFYLLGGMGGGDIKLMAGFGAMLGPLLSLQSAVFAAIAGALIAVGYLSFQALRRSPAGLAIPYAPAIVIGVWMARLAAVKVGQ